MNNTDLNHLLKFKLFPTPNLTLVRTTTYTEKKERKNEKSEEERQRDIKILVNRFLIFDIFSSTQLCVLYSLVGDISNISK